MRLRGGLHIRGSAFLERCRDRVGNVAVHSRTHCSVLNNDRLSVVDLDISVVELHSLVDVVVV